MVRGRGVLLDFRLRSLFSLRCCWVPFPIIFWMHFFPELRSNSRWYFADNLWLFFNKKITLNPCKTGSRSSFKCWPKWTFFRWPESLWCSPGLGWVKTRSTFNNSKWCFNTLNSSKEGNFESLGDIDIVVFWGTDSYQTHCMVFRAKISWKMNWRIAFLKDSKWWAPSCYTIVVSLLFWMAISRSSKRSGISVKIYSKS